MAGPSRPFQYTTIRLSFGKPLAVTETVEPPGALVGSTTTVPRGTHAHANDTTVSGTARTPRTPTKTRRKTIQILLENTFPAVG
jgi:hypothetical protein